MSRRRLARHRVGGGRRAGRERAVRLHLLRHLVAGRRRARGAGPHRGRAARQLHQRAGRRRHGSVPAQRDGAVAAAGVVAHLGAGRAAVDLPRCWPRPPRCPPGAGHRPRPTRVPPPGDMPDAMRAECRRTGQPVPETPARVHPLHPGQPRRRLPPRVRAGGRLSGRDVDVVHLVGGGARNALLCQLTADACGLPVVAGPVEAAAWATRWCRPARQECIKGGLADLRALTGQLETTTYATVPSQQPLTAHRLEVAAPSAPVAVEDQVAGSVKSAAHTRSRVGAATCSRSVRSVLDHAVDAVDDAGDVAAQPQQERPEHGQPGTVLDQHRQPGQYQGTARPAAP